jgi:hypothetical protein
MYTAQLQVKLLSGTAAFSRRTIAFATCRRASSVAHSLWEFSFPELQPHHFNMRFDLLFLDICTIENVEKNWQ